MSKIVSIMQLTSTILDHIPEPAAGWKVYRQTAPKPTEKPPWIIETVTTSGHIVGETQHVHSGIGVLTVRAVSTTTDSVNVIADDLMIPALAGKRFLSNGFDTGALVLFFRFRRVCCRFDRRGYEPAVSGAPAHFSFQLVTPVTEEHMPISLSRHKPWEALS